MLRLLRSKDKYEKLYRVVPKEALDIKTKTILDDYGKFFAAVPDVPRIEEGPFWTWFTMFGHKGLKPDDQAFYKALLKTADEPLAPELEAGLMGQLVAARTAVAVTRILETWNEGGDIDIGVALRNEVEAFELETNRKVKVPWVQDDILDLLKDDENDVGFHWRLPDLNLSMRPLRPGDFGIIAARPDVGKSTFLTDNLTFFAKQVDELFPGQQRTILWFNNEGPGNRIKKRLYNSALGMTGSELVTLANSGVINKAYIEATSRPDIIKVLDVHDFWNHEIEDIMRDIPPAIVVFDMVDNVKFGGNATNNGQRTDQLLEAMYQWSRMMAVKHDAVVLATSQISADGENLAYPTLSMLKDSKTGKQGAADFILTIGYNSDFPSSRYLGLTKNKLARESGPKQPKIEVVFDGQRGRYRAPSELNGAQ